MEYTFLIAVCFALSQTVLARSILQTQPRIFFADVDESYKSNPFEYSRKGAALDYKTLRDQLLGSLIDKEAGLWTTHWSGM